MGGEQRESQPRLTHVDEHGSARMVDVSGKATTQRRATASCHVAMSPETLALLVAGDLPKGDALAVARVAGIMGAKRTSELVPLCHPLPIDAVDVELHPDARGMVIRATVMTSGRTGVEMEAMTAVSVAALTLYDMVKGVERDVRIEALRLERKEGGRSGTWTGPGIARANSDAGTDQVEVAE